MNVRIEDDYLEEVAQAEKLKGNQVYPSDVVRKFQQRLLQIKLGSNLQDLRKIKSLHIEKLEPKATGKYSMRINDAWRIIFRVDVKSKRQVIVILKLSNHYG